MKDAAVEIEGTDNATEGQGFWPHFRRYWYAYIVFPGVIASWFFAPKWIPPLYEWFYPLADNETNLGTFGDMFGYLNALFSGLAFAGIIVTILLQRSELSLQRKELKEARKVASKSQKEFERQAVAMTRQTFENTFFQMVSLHHEIVSGMEFDKQKGRRVFRSAYLYMKKVHVENSNSISVDYVKMYRRYGSTIGHYFRNLYTIVKFIHNSDEADKALYLGILFAQLSKYELLLLFYNCLSPYGGRFKPFVEEHGLLENMQYQDLMIPDDASAYADTAFDTKAPEIREWQKRKKTSSVARKQ